MPLAVFAFIVGVISLFSSIAVADDGHGFTYKYLGNENSVVELKCQSPVFFSENRIAMISIYNTTTMMKMVQVLAGRCPTVEDTSNYAYLYLPGCSSLRTKAATSLKVLITNFDATIVQTFLCNITKLDDYNQTASVVWAVTVEQYDGPKTTETDYSGHLWLPISAYKIISSIEREVMLLEPGVIAAGVILSVILFSLAVQMFLSCKIIHLLEYRRARRQPPLSRSQSKMTDHSKTGPLEEEPFYASV